MHDDKTNEQRPAIHLVCGARPNFMKIAPLYHALRREEWAEPLVVHTGQHYDAALSSVFFEELMISRPDHDLGVGSGAHGEQTGEMLKRLEPIYKNWGTSWATIGLAKTLSAK